MVPQSAGDDSSGEDSDITLHMHLFPVHPPLCECQFLDLLGHRTIIKGPWEDGMGHAQAIMIRPSNSVFEGAADPRCDGLALGW